jgi:hypothetical protein
MAGDRSRTSRTPEENPLMPRLLVLALSLLPLVAGAADEPVPIEQEPRHHLELDNAHVRVFDVDLEPGYESRYHWHRNDGVFVVVASAPTIAQDWGKEPVWRGDRAIGETFFIDYGSHPKAHRVSNAGSTPLHVIDAEILAGCGASAPIAEGPNQTLIIDNARVFVTRIVLHPGESTELHPPCGLLVAVSAGSLRLETPTARQNMDMQPAGFRWHDQTGNVKLVNIGPFVFHGVDIRLK